MLGNRPLVPFYHPPLRPSASLLGHSSFFLALWQACRREGTTFIRRACALPGLWGAGKRPGWRGFSLNPSRSWRDTSGAVLPLPEGCTPGRSPVASSPGRAVCAAPPPASGHWRDGPAGSLAARAPPASRRASGCWCRTPRWTARSPPGWGGTGAACWAYPRLWWSHQSSRGGQEYRHGGKGQRQSRNKSMDVIRVPFPQMDHAYRCLSEILQWKQFSSHLLPAFTFSFWFGMSINYRQQQINKFDFQKDSPEGQTIPDSCHKYRPNQYQFSE